MEKMDAIPIDEIPHPVTAPKPLSLPHFSKKYISSSEEMRMKFLYIFFSLIIAVFLATSTAWSQDTKANAGIMNLKSREFGRRHEHSVRFDHYLHETAIRCRVCHHDFNIFSNRNDGKGSKCSGCHKKQMTKEIPIPLLTAFHKKCIGCHENYIRWGRKSGPIMCGFCHK
ncbi:MAG: cytochrome c3 family protein [Desulfobacterales bacterium]|jgi:hypothetical protein